MGNRSPTRTSASRQGADEFVPRRLAQKLPALAQLLDAYLLAEQMGQDRWQFAVELRALEAAGLGGNDLRLLLSLKYASHAAEVTAARSPIRKFQSLAAAALPVNCCFVLTDAGAVAVERLAAGTASAAAGCLGIKPHWNAKTRELHLGGKLVKRFAVPAENQERVLAVFEEEGWTECVHDPLPPSPEVDGKRRLRDTVKRLNRCRASDGLRFFTDGRGQGIRWRPSPPAAVRQHVVRRRAAGPR
jgi:hypothetical protein